MYICRHMHTYVCIYVCIYIYTVPVKSLGTPAKNNDFLYLTRFYSKQVSLNTSKVQINTFNNQNIKEHEASVP